MKYSGFSKKKKKKKKKKRKKYSAKLRNQIYNFPLNKTFLGKCCIV